VISAIAISILENIEKSFSFNYKRHGVFLPVRQSEVLEGVEGVPQSHQIRRNSRTSGRMERRGRTDGLN